MQDGCRVYLCLIYIYNKRRGGGGGGGEVVAPPIPIIMKRRGTMFKWCFVCTSTKHVKTTRNHSSCQNKGPPVLRALTNHNSLPSNDLTDLYTRLLMIILECRLVVCTCGSCYINHTFDTEALQVALPLFNRSGHFYSLLLEGASPTQIAYQLSQRPSMCKFFTPKFSKGHYGHYNNICMHDETSN